MDKIQKNVLGEKLEECSLDPLTGLYRDGCCNTDENDHGLHTVCARVTTEFLEWCKEAGNDLITPHPEFGFPGLKDGDGWCVCATWYARAVEAGKGCPIFLIFLTFSLDKNLIIFFFNSFSNFFFINFFEIFNSLFIWLANFEL